MHTFYTIVDLMSEMDFCDNKTFAEYFSYFNTEGKESQKTLYKYFVPILIVGCVVSVVLNSLLVIIGNTKTINKSPILVLSLNLATTDCFASILMGISLFVNSYLPIVLGINMRRAQCATLVIEIFRLSALIASAMHLLSLALVHYKGIVKPLHYRAVIFCSQHRTRSIHLMSFICWIIPAIFFGIYFVSIPCQGFLTSECKVHFILTRRFRLIIVISFFIPLIMMLFLYIRIFTIIKSHQEQRSHSGSVRNFNKNNISRSNSVHRKESLAQPNNKPMIASLKWCANCSHSDNSKSAVTKIKSSIDFEKDVSIKSHRSGNFSVRSSLTTSSTKYCFRPQQQVQGHTKALMTTLLILGTYLLCWMPAVVYFALTCVNGCPFPIIGLNLKYRIIFSFITNGLVIFKAIVDPFIYTYRMKEMKVALNRYCFRRANARCSTITSQRSGTMTTLRSTSPSSLKHRCVIAETTLQ